MASPRDYLNQAATNTTYAISSPPRTSQQGAGSPSYDAQPGPPTYYGNNQQSVQPHTTSPTYGVFPGQPGYPGSQPASPPMPPKPVAFFLFFNCKATGSSIHRDKIVEMAVQCWPYVENAPLFQSKVDNTGGGKGKRQDKKKKGQKKTTTHPDDITGHPFPVVWKQFMQWLERILSHATSVIGTQIYPVLVAHHGDTYDFHFLFRALENHGIDLGDPANLDIHFCDPVPLLQQYKDYAHPWLIESRSMAIGSLLNDWLPGQFDVGDLYICPGKTWLAAKLYTQTPMYNLLKEFPVYSTDEWIEYYDEVKQYKEDKKSLEDNFPANMPDVQRKFAVRSLLQWGYNWEGLIELYKTCTSPEHFRQEVKDCDLKSGAASQLTWKFVDMKLAQDGTRQYTVRIKENMPPQRYTHLTDRRGRWWILRVKNELPPCIYSMDDVYTKMPSASQWRAPDNLLLIRYPEAWYPMPGEAPNEDDVIDQMRLGDLTFNSEDDDNSDDSWDPEEDEEAAMRQSLQPLEDLIKHQPEPPPITSLVFGDETTAFNPFTDRGKQKGLQSELRKDDRVKATKSLWDSIKEPGKEAPSSFGQAIKFCRPAGSQDPRSLKKNERDEEMTDTNRKGQKGKIKEKKGNKGAPERFERSQSWTEDGGNENKKTDGNQPKARTVSCSIAESLDDESSFIPAKESKSEEILPQAKGDNDTNNEAAHRMINFHLAKNNNKSRNRRKKNGRSNNKTESEKEDQKTKQECCVERNRQGSVDQSSSQKAPSWGQGKPASEEAERETKQQGHVGRNRQGSVDKSKSNTDIKITFGAAPGNTAWGKDNTNSQKAQVEVDANKTPPPWGPICNAPSVNTNAGKTDSLGRSDSSYKQTPVSSRTVFASKKEVSHNESILSGKRPNWGKHQQDSEIVIDHTDSKKTDKASNSGTKNSAGVRRPKKASKAQVVASKTAGLGVSANQQRQDGPQKAVRSGPIIIGQPQNKPLFGTAHSDSNITVLGRSQQTLSFGSAWNNSNVTILGQSQQTGQQTPSFGTAHRNSKVTILGQSQETPSFGTAQRSSNVTLLGQAQQTPSFGTAQRSSNVTILGQSKQTPSFGTHPQQFNNQPKNTRQSSGFHQNRTQNKGDFGQRNTGGNGDFGQRRNAKGGSGQNNRSVNNNFGQNDRSGNKKWNQPTKSTQNVSNYTPVVTNEIVDDENWDDEIGDDGCFGL